MNLRIARRLDMLKRIILFMAEFPITLSRAISLRQTIAAIIVVLEEAARNQVGGAGAAEGGVDLRESIARELRDYLKDVNRTARTLEEHTGIRPTFRLPKSGSYPALIATARSIIATATNLEAAFLAAGMRATFLSELNALLAAFEDATRRKFSGRAARVRGTAGLKIQADLGVIAATKLDACVRNHFRGQPEIIAAWAHARHIERDPVRTKKSSPSTKDVHPSTQASAPTAMALVLAAAE